MFNFRDYIHPKPTAFTVQVPDAYLERLDNIAKALAVLEHQNHELARSLRRVETKLVKFGIAAGYPDAVRRDA